MAAITLVGTAAAVLLLVVVALALARGNDWRRRELLAPEGDQGRLQSLAGRPTVWALVFLAGALGITLLVLAAVGGFGVTLPGGAAVAVAPFALLLLAFLVGGTYAAVRDRNVSPAGATMAAALVVAALLLVAISGKLLMGP